MYVIFGSLESERTQIDSNCSCRTFFALNAIFYGLLDPDTTCLGLAYLTSIAQLIRPTSARSLRTYRKKGNSPTPRLQEKSA